jgi:hypothetical protein
MTATVVSRSAEGDERARRILLRQIELKFGPIDASTRVRIDAVADSAIDAWLERLIGADSLDELLAPPEIPARRHLTPSQWFVEGVGIGLRRADATGAS